MIVYDAITFEASGKMGSFASYKMYVVVRINGIICVKLMANIGSDIQRCTNKVAD